MSTIPNSPPPPGTAFRYKLSAREDDQWP